MPKKENIHTGFLRFLLQPMTNDDEENIDFLESCKLALKEEKTYLPLIYSTLCVS